MIERTLYLTDWCPHECEFCSSDAGPCGRIFVDTEWALAWLADTDAEFVHVSGGEPLAHPGFWPIWQAVKDKVGDNRMLWTNAIPRLGYNKHVRPTVELHPAVICTDDDTHLHVLKLVEQGRAARGPKVTLSGQWRGDCGGCDHRVLLPDGVEAVAPCKKGVAGCASQGSHLHDLKCWPEMFEKVLDGSKPFEYRFNDRGFDVGDVLQLHEWRVVGHVGNTDAEARANPIGEYTGRTVRVEVTSLVSGGRLGVPADYCVMGIKVVGRGKVETAFLRAERDRLVRDLAEAKDMLASTKSGRKWDKLEAAERAEEDAEERDGEACGS